MEAQQHRDALDHAVRTGNFEAACAAAKLYATARGGDGRFALVALVEAVERVLGR